MPKLLTMKEAIALCRISDRSLRRAIAVYDFPPEGVLRFGDRVTVDAVVLERWVEGKREKAITPIPNAGKRRRWA